MALFFFLCFTEDILILPSAVVALIDALQGDCCLLPVFYREENKGREWWKLALNRVSSRSLEVPGRERVF